MKWSVYRQILSVVSVCFVLSVVYMLSRTSRNNRVGVKVASPIEAGGKLVLKCSEPPCMERLSRNDVRQHYKCIERTQKLSGNAVLKDNGCFFLSSDSRLPVALISFPGSGNTWVRQILEAVSGVCTGSTMCDMSLRAQGFTGENIQSGSVLVVKTHSSAPDWIVNSESPTEDVPHFHSAILIIRNPFDAMVSEWSRRVSNHFQIKTTRLHAHIQEISATYFGTNKKWNSFVHYEVKHWQEIIYHWLIKGEKAGREVLVVHYEQLKRNKNVQIKRMLDFLGLKTLTTPSSSQNFSAFHRRHKKEFEPYTKKQKQYILTTIKNTMKELQQSHLQSKANLTQYLV